MTQSEPGDRFIQLIRTAEGSIADVLDDNVTTTGHEQQLGLPRQKQDARYIEVTVF